MKGKKFATLLLALALCLSFIPAACGETEYPPRPAGAAADLAGVLGEKAAQDLDTLLDRTMEAGGFGFYVLTRHFLGGANAQEYADKVFEVWGLGGSDALLLMVIGEETYALSLGAAAKSALPAETTTSLLGAFRAGYLNRQYDAALADLSVGLGQALAKAFGETLDASGLFGREAIQSATPQPQTASDFWYGMFAQDDYDALEDDDAAFWRSWQDQQQSEETHINWRSVIIWGLVIYFLFFRRRRKARR